MGCVTHDMRRDHGQSLFLYDYNQPSSNVVDCAKGPTCRYRNGGESLNFLGAARVSETLETSLT